MRTLGLIRAAAPPPHDLWPRLRMRLAEADETVRLELPEFGWSWRLAATGAVLVPVLVPDPLLFLTASGLL
jgi:hypothetical protein